MILINKQKRRKVEESKKRRRKRISKDVSQPKDSASKLIKNKNKLLTKKLNLLMMKFKNRLERLRKLQGKSQNLKGQNIEKIKEIKERFNLKEGRGFT
ncbi:MAG: hypothetical protein CM15mP102_01880 [Flavobacteriales bacterium]|nr:MAG: hypothetical protein CM15mP102_01880 [Flavobacteriales bacterium]